MRLRNLFRNREDDLQSWIDWSSFEQLLVEYDVIRTSLLYYYSSLCGNRDSCCPVSKLYPGFIGNKNTLSQLDHIVKLEKRDPIKLCHQFPHNNQIVDYNLPLKNDKGNIIENRYKYVFSPATGSVDDYFSFRKITSEEDSEEDGNIENKSLLVVGQAKLYTSDLSCDDIIKEAQNQRLSSPRLVIITIMKFRMC